MHRPPRRSRSSLFSLVVFASVVGAAVAACGSDDSGTNGETGGTDSGAGGAGDGGASHADGGAPSADSGGGHDATTGDGGSTTTTTGDAATDGGYDTSPVVPKNFPLDTPGIGGYTLTDAFPGAEPLDIPAVITFARTDTANKHPFVLERTGQIRRMADDGTWDYQHPVVDFSAKVNVQGEGGAVGMVLHPSFGDGTGTHDFIYV